MADLEVGRSSKSLDIGDAIVGYSRVIIKTGEQDGDGNDIVYIAGDDTGYTLEIENPWGTQEIADDILAKILGYPYQPYDAGDAIVNPAFEIGDSVLVGDVYSGVFDAGMHFSSLFTADIAAPYEKEIDHEYAYEDSKERKYTRKINDAVARLNFYADKIEAKVDSNGGSDTFGWSVTSDEWSVFNENGTLFSINENGTYVKGEINADSGVIGGFTIGANALYKDMTSLYDTEHNGVYIGINGISLGKGAFRVDAAGNMYAQSGTFDGNVYAKNIQYGGGAGYFSGSGILGSSLGTYQFDSGVVSSLGFADFSWDVFNNRQVAEYISCKWTVASRGFSAPEYWIDSGEEEGGGTVGRHTHQITVDENTGKVTLGRPDFSGAYHSFNIADTEFYQNAVSAGAEEVNVRTIRKNPNREVTYGDSTHIIYYPVHANTTANAEYRKEVTLAVPGQYMYELGLADGGGSQDVTIASEDIVSIMFRDSYTTLRVRATASNGATNTNDLDISTAWNNGYEIGYRNGQGISAEFYDIYATPHPDYYPNYPCYIKDGVHVTKFTGVCRSKDANNNIVVFGTQRTIEIPVEVAYNAGVNSVSTNGTVECDGYWSSYNAAHIIIKNSSGNTVYSNWIIIDSGGKSFSL